MKSIKTAYFPGDVAFCWDDDISFGDWERCREVFEDEYCMTKKKIFFFFPHKTSVADTISLLVQLEKRFNTKSDIKEVELTGFSGTVRAIRIKPSKFWRKYSIRFSFLTAVLKTFAKTKNALSTLKKKGFVDFFKKSKYFKHNKYALRYFWSKFGKVDSKFLNKFDGKMWTDTFKYLTKKKTKKALLAA